MKQLKSIYEIDAERIVPHPDNPRKELGDLSELTASVRANGIMQDITVMHENCLTDPPEEQGANVAHLSEGTFVVLMGHRRLAAFKEAFPEGGKVRCRIVYGLSRAEQVGMMMEENMHREDLTVPEQIESFQLMLDLGETVASVAEKTGFSETTVRRRVANADAVDGIRSCGFQLTVGDMDALAGLPEKEKMDVLKRAGDSKQLKAMVEQKEREIKRNEAIEDIISKLKAAGVREYDGDNWYGLDAVESIRIDGPEDFEPDWDGECYFKRPDRWDYWIYVRKEPEEKPEDDAGNEARARRKEAKRRLDSMNDTIEGRMEAFIAGILAKKYRSENADVGGLRRKIFGDSTYFNAEAVVALYGEDEEDAMDRLAESGERELLIAAAWAWMDRQFVSWDGSLDEDAAGNMEWIAGLLGEYGFPPLDEEETQALDGTHPLYRELDNA